MQYDNYRNKVLRVSEFLTKVVKHRVLIGSIAGTVLTILIALMVTIGLPGRVECGTEFTYGDAYDCQAKAFLSKVHFAYAQEGSDQWSTDQPYLPGNYQVRAVGRSVFGKDRPGKPTSFRILPYPLAVHIQESSLLFGTNPTFLAEPTKYGDRVYCDGFVYADLTATTTAVSPNLQKIRVLDTDGNDVTIAYALQAIPVDVTFQRRPLELLVGSSDKIYDATALTYEQYQIVEGYTLGVNDTIVALFTGSQTDAGSSENGCTLTIQHIEDGVATDVTGQYDLVLTPGTLTVEKRPLTVTTGSLETVYTGQPVSCPEFTLDDPSALLPGHTIVVDSWGVTSDYFYNVDINPPVSWTGIWGSSSSIMINTSPIDCGTYPNVANFKILDADGNDVTANYNIIQNLGIITITPAPLTVTTGSGTWEYDGQTHTAETHTIEGLLSGHQVTQINFPGLADAGIMENKVTLTIADEKGKDVTTNYNIIQQPGMLQVTKRPITINTGSGSWVYDSQYHSAMPTTTNMVQGHSLLPSNLTVIHNVGTKENRSTFIIRTSNSKGADVTDNYDITYVYGTLTVSPRALTIATDNGRWIYDGQPHSSTGYTTKNLAEGDVIEATNWASLTDAGKCANTCSIVIRDTQLGADNQGDMSGNYTITLDYGTLQVDPRPITVAAWDTQKVYDGTPLYGGDPYVPADSPHPLVEGHTLSATVSGSRTDVGVSESRVSKCKVFDGARDVTSNYAITATGGKITILQARVLVTAASDAKVYDGTPLKNSEFTIEVLEGQMKSGDSVRATVSGSITDPGTEPNAITAKIVDRYGRDVSENYEVLTQNGSLTIIAPSESAEFSVGKIMDNQSAPIYLRQHSYGSFTGQGWTGAIEYGKTLPGGLSYNYLSSFAIANSGGYAHVAEFRDMAFYMLPYYMSAYGDYDIPGSDSVYSSDRQNYTVSYYTLPATKDGFDYLKGHLGEYTPYEEEYRKFVHQWYLTIDEASRNYMLGIIKEEGFSLSDPQVIQKIAEYIQQAAVYSTTYPMELDMEENVAIAFLEEYKTGKCTHYATAATLLYRALGIPARYVEGFMLTTSENVYVDIMTPGHAWVEVYIDGVGWIQVEVTGPDPNGGGGGGGSSKEGFTITPSYSYKNHDGKPLQPQQRVDPDPYLCQLLEQGYTYKVSISGQQNQPGCSSSTIDSFTLFNPQGKDVTNNYHITCEEGVLEVFPADTKIIRIYLYELQKYYDGSALRFSQDDYTIINLPKDVSLSLRIDISLEEPGYLTLAALNKDFSQYGSFSTRMNNRDITSSCRVVFDLYDSAMLAYVPICLDGQPLEITTASQSKEDDGTPLSNSECFISRGALLAGHRMVAKAKGYLDTVGEIENEFDFESFQILDAKGNDVTHLYQIRIVPGLLTITPAL
jgi:uncharacterized protein YnzC (UPF0291/DUF896 family)